MQPGVVFLMNSGVGVTVNGALITNGTAASPVVLTSSQDVVNGGSGVVAPGQWTALQFSGSGSSASQLNNTFVQYGQQVTLTGSSPQFNGVTIASMSALAMSMDLASSPSGSGNAAFGSPLNGIDIPAGTISQSATWGIVGIPYVVRSGQVSVGQGAGTVNLTIAPGVVVKLSDIQNGGTILYVTDTLTAVGTAAAPIIFTSIRDSSVDGVTNLFEGATPPGPAGGNWRSVLLDGAKTGASQIQNVVMRYAGNNEGGTLWVRGASAPTITNSTFTLSSQDGLRLETGAAPVVTNNVISGNGRYGIHAGDITGGLVTLRNNVFQGNASIGAYLASAADVSSNTFSGNGTGVYFNAGGVVPFNQNTFTNNAIIAQIAANVYLNETTPNVVGAGNQMAGIDVLPQNWTQSGTWGVLSMPYVVRNGQVSVGTGAGTVNLTISPGVVVKLSDIQNGGTILYVNDTLTAVGTATAPIFFTSIRDSSVGGVTNLFEGATPPGPAGGNWRSVLLDGAKTGASQIQNVVMRYAGNNEGGTLWVRGASAPTITNSTFTLSSQDGLRLETGAAPVVTNNVISGNGRYGIHAGDITGGLVTLRDNVFQGNAAIGAYLASAADVSSNTFDRNGTGVYFNTGGMVPFNQNTFKNNSIIAQIAANVYLNETTPNVVGAGNQMAGIDVLPQNWTQSGTWGVLSMPYVVRNGQVSIGTGAGTVNLTIAPGVVVKLSDIQNGGTILYVNDTLTAVGTATAPIFFTSIRDSSVGGVTNLFEGATAPGPAGGNWRSVLLDGAKTGASQIQNVVMRYAGNNEGGTLWVRGASAPTITNSTFTLSSQDGLRLESGAAPTVTNNAISGNGRYGIHAGDITGGLVTLRNNVFQGNAAIGAYLAAAADVSSNTFSGNGAGVYFNAGGVVPFNQNTFTNNSGSMVEIGPNVYLSGGGNVVGAGNANAGIDITGGMWTTSGTWQNIGLPYLIRSGFVQVGSGSGAVTLTIAPGVVIKGYGRTNGGFRLQVSDTLLALGTPSQPITFTSWRDSTIGGVSNLADGVAPARGDTNEINISGPGSSASRLENVVVRYAGGDTGAGVYINSSTATVRNCDVSLSSNMGIALDGNAAPTIDGCYVHDNSGRGLAYVSSSGAMTLINNTFARNASWGADLYSAANVSSNTFDSNGDGLYFERPGTAATIAFASNTFVNNGGDMALIGPNVYLSGGGNVVGAGNANAGIDITGGMWTSSGTWQNIGLPYLIRSGFVQVGSGSGAVTLTIAPGVVIKGYGRTNGGFRLQVSDTLLALGTPSQPITFTSWRDSTIGGVSNLADGVAPARGDTNEINVSGPGSSASRLENVVVRYAGGDTGAGVYINSSTATVRNCDVSQSSNMGIALDGNAAPTIDGCYVHDNSGRGLAYVSSSGAETLTNNTFARNASWGADLYSAANVSSNTFDSNGDGLYFERPGTAATIAFASNTFVNNGGDMALIGPNVYLSGGGNVVGAGNANAGIDITGGMWTTSGTWQNIGLPYLIRSGFVQVGSGSGAVTLTIAPGVVIKGYGRTNGGFRLQVSDTLLAIGTPSQPITFTSWRDSTIGGVSNLADGVAPARGDTNEINISGSGSSASRLENVVVRYAGGDTGAGVYVNSSTATVRNCDVSQSSNMGIALDGNAAPTIDGCYVHDNSGRGIAYVSSSGAETLTNNTIARNASWGADLYSAANVSSNVFDSNGDGLYIERPGTAATVAFASNTFVNNGGDMALIGSNVYLSGGGNAAGAGNANAGIDLAGGTWTNSGTWQNTGLPYLLRSGQVQVGTGSGAVTLTIAPGVVVKQYGRTNGGIRLLVDDTLTAVGTSSQPITFTSWRDSSVGGVSNLADGGAAAPGDANEIYLNGLVTSGSQLVNVVVEYAGSDTGSGIYIASSSATVKNSQVKLSSNNGISVHGVTGTPFILATLLTQNPYGLITDTKAIPEIHGCNIQGNTTAGVQNNDTSVVVDAQENYWGSASGPRNATSNPSGLGDVVSNYVNFSNYLSAAASFIQPQVTSSQLINPSPVRPGTSVSIKIFFNEGMDTSVAPTITYGASSPYTAFSITGGTWTTSAAFSATTLLPALPDGAYTMAISGARDAIANVLTPSQQPFYTIDGTPPNAPVLSSATPRSGGVVALGWQAPGGETPTVYVVYRATSVFTSAAQAVQVTTVAVAATSYNDLPPADGAYDYAVSARDFAGNESALSNLLSATSVRAAPSAPTNLVGVFDPVLKQITLTWTAPSTGTAVSYNVYRSSALIANATSTAYVDHPTADALELYEVAALDALGNVSARSTSTLVAFDIHPPVITIGGVTNGEYTSANVTTSISITDFSSFASTVTLNGQPFVGGTVLTQPGTYFLAVQAQDVYANASSTTLSFTIDKASPTLTILSPVSGLVTNQNVLLVYQSTDDFTPANQIVVKDQNGVVYASSTLITTEGARNLTLTATDLAGNQTSSSVSFTLDKTPPAVVSDLRVTSKNPGAGQATLAWTTPHDALSGTAGYLIKTATFAITSANFASAQTLDYSSAPLADGSTEQFVVQVATTQTVFFALKSSDAAGNFSAVSNVAFWDLDGPLLSGLTPAAGTGVSRPTTFLLQASDLSGVASIAFSVDGVVLSTAVSSPYTFPWNTLAYADGTHAVRFDAVDVVGNPSSLSASYTLAYQPPPAPAITSPSGTFATVVATVTFVGTAEAGTTVQIQLNGFPLVSGVADSSGHYSLLVTLPAQGSLLLTAVATDPKGASSPSASVTVNYNLTAPNTPAALDAQTMPAGHIALTWQLPGGKVPSSYDVYRSTDALALSPGVVPSPLLLVQTGVSGTAVDDLPPQDGLFYYGVTALDLSGNESGLSNVAPAAADRVVPTAAVVFLDTAPPLGPGDHILQLTLSKTLAAPPLLVFTPAGQSPLPIGLSASSPTVWIGTLTVTSAMASGAGSFGFEGTDFAGNVGHTLTAGGSALIDTTPPSATIALSPASPVKAGPVALTLTLNKPVPSAPSLSYVLASGSTVTAALSGGPTIWTSTLTIASGTDGTASFVFASTDALGNTGSSLTGVRTFVIDTTAPGAPTLLHAASEKAGVIALTWSSPIDGPPASYSAYRGGVLVSSGLPPHALGAGSYSDLPPSDGTYSYAVTAVDAAGNESAPSGTVPQISRRTPPPAPLDFVANLNAFSRIELSWQSASTETPNGYNLYRSTSAISSLAGITPVFVSTPPVTDTPPSNSLYNYAVTAIDFAGNESTAFATTQFLWDNAPPIIAISGVLDGHFYNQNLNPAFTVSDPALATATVAGVLDGSAFVSGSTVSAEGAHVLTVTGANQTGIGSTSTVHFALDKTPPSISVTGVAAGQSYNAAVIPVVNVTDTNLAAVAVKLDGSAYTPGVPVSANGTHLLNVTASDLAGNVATSSVTFVLALPPSAPQGVALVYSDGVGASLTWTASANVLGYRVYKDGALVTQGLLSAANFTDSAYAFDGSHTFSVSAVDLNGQEGDKTLVTMPNVALSLASYGLTDGNGVTALNRGFFDTVSLGAANNGTQSVLTGPALLELVASGQTVSVATAPAATAPAGGAATLAGVLATPVSLPDSASLRATLTVASQLGTSAKIVKVFTVAARTPSTQVLQLFAAPLVLNTSPNVQVKVNNQGSAALEVLTNPSDVTVQLLTTQGTLLSSAKETQTDNGALTSPSGYYVSVPPGGSALLDAAALFVPSALGSSGQVTAALARTYNGLATGNPLVGQGFSASRTYSGVTSPPYNVTVAANRSVYDQGSTVLLSGVAVSTDGSNTLIPSATVQVGVSLRGFDRVASTMTDASGHYQVTFSPTPAEAGLYTLWASNPSVTNHVPQSSFTIVGFGFQYGNYAASLVQNSTVNFTVNLINTGQSNLTGLSAQISSSSAVGVGLTLNASSLPSTLASGQSATLAFSATASPSAALGASGFTVTAQESDGFLRTLPVTVTVAPSAAVPVANPQTFNVGMAAGASRTLTVVLTNQGTQAWTGVTVSSAALPWVTLQGSASLGDVPPGGTAQVNLVLAPPANLASQAFASNPLVSINSTNAGSIPINTLITITSSGQGAVQYSAINADKPRDSFGNGVGIANAAGTLTSLDIAGLTFSAAGDANGGVRFVNVPAGRYSASISATGFQTENFTQVIEAGVTTSREVVMPTNVVSYTWSVTPTTIQDQYNISLSITFQTDVPAPAVVTDPAVLNFALPDAGGDVDSQITITNKGLVAAHNVNVLPNINDPAVTITVPYSTIATLNAGQSVVVPFHLHLAHSSCHSFQFTFTDDYTCAAGVTVTQVPPSINGSAGSCYNTPTTTVGGGGGGGGFSTGGATGSGGGSSGVSLAVSGAYVSVAIPNPPAVPATPSSCQAPTNKQPSNCFICDLIASFSDPGGDPRIPETDLSLNVPIFGGSLDFTRVYDSQDGNVGSLGMGWMHSFESRVFLRWAATMFFQTGGAPQGQLLSGGGGGGGSTLSVTQSGGASPTATQPINPDILAELRSPDGRRLRYTRNADGSFTPPVGETGVLTMSGSTTAPTGYAWTLLDKTIYQYDGTGKLLTITDRNGNIVTLDYSGGLLSDVKDPNGRILYTFAYSGQHLASVTDLAGRAVNFTYNGGGQLAQAVGPKGTTSYGYSNFTVPGVANVGEGALVPDASFTQSGGVYVVASNYSDPTISLLTSVTSPNGFTTTFTLGAPQNVVDYTAVAKQQQLMNVGGGGGGGGAVYTAGTSHPTENKGYYTPLLPNGTNSFAIDKNTFAAWYYPQKFWTLSESGPLGTYSMNYTIDELLEQGSTVVTDPRGFKTTHKWKTVNGQTISTDIIDPDNADTAVVYDAQNNPVQVTDRAGRTTASVYNASNQPTQITDPLGNKTFLSYEPNFHQLNATTDPRGNSTQLSFDAKGNVIQIQDAQNNSAHFSYDTRGLAASVSDPLNNSVQIIRDASGHATSFTDPLNRTATLGYDAQGRITSVMDPAGKTTQFTFGADDDLMQVRDALGGLTHYNFTSGLISGTKLLSSVQDENGKTTQFAYDSLGRLTSVINPDNQARSLAYDAANNLSQVTKPDGTLITFTYDNLGRLTQKNILGDPVIYAYDAVGNVVIAENNESKIQIAYDADDRPTRVIQTNKAANLISEVDYQYDASGNRTKTTLQANPAPFVWSYVYDSLNRLTSITNPSNKVFAFTYDALGRRTQLLYPNGVRANYSFDSASQITGIVYTNTNTGVVVSSVSYAYDGAGDPTSMADAAGAHQYAYDDDHRLTSAIHPAASTLSDKSESFSYDPAGNRLSDDVRSGYAYDAANRLQQNSQYTYTYDANGNQTNKTDRMSGAQAQYSWNHSDQLTSIALSGGETIDFKYDPFGRLIEETFSTTTVLVRRFVYAGSDIIAVADANNNLSALVTHGPGNTEPLSMDLTANSYYLHADEAGSIKALTDSSGQVTERVEYTGYGSPTFSDAAGNIFSTSRIWNIFAHAGAEWIGDAGLSRHGLRFMDVQTGSFISEEAYGYDGLNKYWYALDNPTGYADRNGAYAVPVVAPAVDPVVAVVAGLSWEVVLPSVIIGAAAYIAYEKYFKKSPSSGNGTPGGGGPPTITCSGSGEPPEDDPDDRSNWGPHSVAKRDETNKVLSYETRIPQTNPDNPNPWELQKRFDGAGKGHFNKSLGQDFPTPHVHDPLAPGGVRSPTPDELPPGY